MAGVFYTPVLETVELPGKKKKEKKEGKKAKAEEATHPFQLVDYP